MKWPFVPRETFNDLLTQYTDLQLRAERRDSEWAERYERVVSQLAKLAEREHPEPVKLSERTRDEVVDAILSRAGNNGQLRTHLTAWAMRQRREHVPDDKIVQGILVWESPDEDGVS